MGKKPKDGLKVIGETDEGDPICVGDDGRIIIGEGCFEQYPVGEDLYVRFDPTKCKPKIADAYEKLLNKTIAKGGKTIYISQDPDYQEFLKWKAQKKK